MMTIHRYTSLVSCLLFSLHATSLRNFCVTRSISAFFDRYWQMSPFAFSSFLVLKSGSVLQSKTSCSLSEIKLEVRRQGGHFCDALGANKINGNTQNPLLDDMDKPFSISAYEN